MHKFRKGRSFTKLKMHLVEPCSESRQEETAFLPIVNIFAKSYMRARSEGDTTSHLDLGKGERKGGRGGFHLDR